MNPCKTVKNYGRILRIFSYFLSNSYEKFFLSLMRHIDRTDSVNKTRSINYNKLIQSMSKRMFLEKSIQLKFKENDFSSQIRPKILILSSEIYDSGGHTEVALRFIESFKGEFDIDFLLTTFTLRSEISAPVKSKIIKSCAKNYIEFDPEKTCCKKIIDLYAHVLNSKYTTIIVNIHVFDVVSCAVLGLLKEYSNINIIYWNHADHLYALGMDFANVILTRNKAGRPLTPHIKDKKNFNDFYFLEKSNETHKYTHDELNELKKELGIPPYALVTISGASFYKFGEGYFKLIDRILKENVNVYHIFMCSCSEKSKRFINKYVGAQNRFIRTDFSANFDKYIQISDIFIDSFPQGSALTLVDFIKHAKPVIIKVDEKDPIRSFETYLHDDYAYSCKTSEEMFKKICELVCDKEKYSQISKEVRNFYEKKYNIETVKQRYRELF